MVKLNGSAGEIMTRCDGATTVADITADLERELSVTGLAGDVDAFVRHGAGQAMAADARHESHPAGAPARTRRSWLLLELTYRCPLHCVFCYNPTDFATTGAGARHARTGFGCCVKRARWGRCSSVCRAVSRWRATTSSSSSPKRIDLGFTPI